MTRTGNTIGAIHGAIRAAGLDEETARDLYERETGKRSLRAMDGDEQRSVLTRLRQLGPQTKAGGPYGKKLQALWIDGWHLGVVDNRHDEAMLKFVAGRTGIQTLRFLRDPGDARKAVEALKKWLTREGGVDWSAQADPADAVIAAQGKRLELDGRAPTDMSAIAQAWRAFRGGELRADQRHEVMQLFGAAIRRRKGH